MDINPPSFEISRENLLTVNKAPHMWPCLHCLYLGFGQCAFLPKQRPCCQFKTNIDMVHLSSPSSWYLHKSNRNMHAFFVVEYRLQFCRGPVSEVRKCPELSVQSNLVKSQDFTTATQYLLYLSLNLTSGDEVAFAFDHSISLTF